VVIAVSARANPCSTRVSRAEQLRDTVDDLVSLARGTPTGDAPLDIPALLADLTARWHGPFATAGRRLTIPTAPDLPEIAASAAAIRQILDVIVDNALTHGAGTTRVYLADLGGGISIEVSDEGTGLSGDPEAAFARRADGSGHGIGLALARSLAEAEGGRLVVRRPGAGPTFSLLLATPRTGNPDPEPS
jgi:signal transduction histidine kinase